MSSAECEFELCEQAREALGLDRCPTVREAALWLLRATSASAPQP